MSEGLPRGSGAPDGEARTPGPPPVAVGRVPVVVVVSAPWAPPSRPAPTVLRELGRRWRETLQVLVVEDPTEELLEAWAVQVLPTWLRFDPAASTDGEDDLVLPVLAGTDLEGRDVSLPGPWHLVRRLTGAQPKHVIHAEFGPES